jgi:hypothetical protein
MSRDPYDEVDRALADGLAGLAPVAPSGDKVLESVRPRFRRARARARAAKAGGALVALLAVASVATLTAPHSGRTHVQVGSGSTQPGSTRPAGSSSTTVSTTAPARPGVAHVPTTATSSVPARSGTTSPGTVQSTTPTTTSGNGGARGGGPGPSDGSGPGRGGSTTTVAPSQPDDVQTYRATGGSIIVRLAGNAASLDKVSPAAGYGYTVHDDGPTRVEVRFTRAGEEVARIDVDVEGGHLVRVQHGG